MPRDHSYSNTETHRLQTLKRSVLLIGIIQSSNSAWTVKELTKAYNDRIGSMSKKTVSRYLKTFEQIGLVESKEVKTGRQGNPPLSYTWLGWPAPIYG